MTAFDDGKDEGALRTIGEVSEALGIRPHVLRYWEAQFPLLKPLKRSAPSSLPSSNAVIWPH
ncbi:MerR family DNA-binding transcriptional regulator, partial [Erythrobacter donghaensis]|uniref:MerR family DNA-binding transcriptional regulator n=1 Tax=Erythrobacter donghaensis TaxID=267135 RepID=UPI000A58573E